MERNTRLEYRGCHRGCFMHDLAPLRPEVCPAQLLQTSSSSYQVQRDQAAELYSPIKDWQTRILRLHPGSVGDDLHLDLFVADLILGDGVVNHRLQEKITYEALSYCWGEPIYDAIAEVNGTPYPITQNLHMALQRIRVSDELRYLWADALCINQHDEQERSIQVRNMLSIYKKAKTVLVWLGQPDADTRFCLEYRQGLTPYMEAHKSSPSDDLTQGQRGLSNTLHPNVEARRAGLVQDHCKTHTERIFRGLKKLFGKPWYTRLWVRQEIWAAKDIAVLCGTYTMGWGWLQQAAILTNNLGRRLGFRRALRGQLELLFKGLRQADAVTLALIECPQLTPVAEKSRLQNYAVDLVHVIQGTVDCRCSDKRDRIYGILGMTCVTAQQADSASRPGPTLSINYSHTTAAVFLNAAVYVMVSDWNCSLLFLKATYGGMVDGEQLPSWCPDWSKPFALGAYNSGLLSRKWRGETKMTFNGETLHIVGRQVGSVTGVTSMPSEETGLDPGLTDVVFWDNEQSRSCQVFGRVEENDLVIHLNLKHYAIILRPAGADRVHFVGWMSELFLEAYYRPISYYIERHWITDEREFQII